MSFGGSWGGEAISCHTFYRIWDSSDYIWETCVFLFVFWTAGNPLIGMIRKMNAVLADHIGKMRAILLIINDLKENGNNLVTCLNKQVVLPDIILFPSWNNLILLSANFQEAISYTALLAFV